MGAPYLTIYEEMLALRDFPYSAYKRMMFMRKLQCEVMRGINPWV